MWQVSKTYQGNSWTTTSTCERLSLSNGSVFQTRSCLYKEPTQTFRQRLKAIWASAGREAHLENRAKRSYFYLFYHLFAYFTNTLSHQSSMFKCNKCKKVIIRYENKLRHKRSCGGLKHQSWHICYKQFSRSDAKRRQIEQVHDLNINSSSQDDSRQVQIYICSQCKKQVQRCGGLQRHIKPSHKCVREPVNKSTQTASEMFSDEICPLSVACSWWRSIAEQRRTGALIILRRLQMDKRQSEVVI